MQKNLRVETGTIEATHGPMARGKVVYVISKHTAILQQMHLISAILHNLSFRLMGVGGKHRLTNSGSQLGLGLGLRIGLGLMVGARARVNPLSCDLPPQLPT